MIRIMLSLAVLPPILSACDSGTPAPTPSAPAHAEAVAHEAELLKLTLTPRAQQRLGLRIERVADGSTAMRRETSGEIVVPNAQGGVPTNSMSNLAQLGTQQVAADAEVSRARAQAKLARIALDRASALVREEAGSIRARDEAAAALATANAAVEAAVGQRRLLGPAVGSLNDQSSLWVRVPVFGSDVAMIARDGAAEVSPLGDGGTPRIARPVKAPPSSNAVAGTVDLYFAIQNRDRAYRVGQRVAVALPLAGGQQAGLSVPTSAIVQDMYGGEWVYEKVAANQYLRQRVEVASSDDGRAILSRGLRPGMEIVTVGAMELFGTEFGVAH